jgi:hypothetical protein
MPYRKHACNLFSLHSIVSSELQVLLLPDYGLHAPIPRARPLQPLHLPDPDPLLTHLAAESAAYWGGLQALTGAPLLAAQQSLDVVLDPDWDHAGALGFSKLQVRFMLWGPAQFTVQQAWSHRIDVVASFGPCRRRRRCCRQLCLSTHCGCQLSSLQLVA